MNEIVLAAFGRIEPARRWNFAGITEWCRVALLLPILPVEILLLTLRFDAEQLAEQSGLWAGLLVNSSRLLKILLAATAAALLFSNARMWRDGQRVIREQSAASRWWLYLAAHAVSFVAFAALTDGLFTGDLLRARPALWSSAWFAFGLLTFASWLAALVAPSLWLQLVRIAATPLLCGGAVGLAAWGFGIATVHLWRPLGEATFEVVSTLLSLTGAEVISDPHTMAIGTAAFAVEIEPACSGYEGIGLILVFLGAYVAMFRRHLRFPQVLLLFPAGVVLIWLANAARIAGLIAIGSAGGQAIALGGFHSQAGWLAFNALALGFVLLTTRVSFFRANFGSAAPAREALDPTVAYLGPWLAILTMTLVLAAFTAGFDWFYPTRVMAAAAVLWLCRKAYGVWDGSWSWNAVLLGVLVFGVWVVMAPAEMLVPVGPSAAWREAGPVGAGIWLAFRLVGSIVTVPLAEELAFRGYLTRRLVRSDFQQLPLGGMTVLSFVGSSVLFGLLHGSCWPAGIVAGFLFALALRIRGRLADAVAAHLTANCLLCLYILCTGNWLLWN